MLPMDTKIIDVLLGLSIGDAIGVPVEFLPRTVMVENPVTDMAGFGTHNQPPGTWSDHSSFAFCLVESLCNGYNLQDIASNFILWYDENF